MPASFGMRLCGQKLALVWDHPSRPRRHPRHRSWIQQCLEQEMLSGASQCRGHQMCLWQRRRATLQQGMWWTELYGWSLQHCGGIWTNLSPSWWSIAALFSKLLAFTNLHISKKRFDMINIQYIRVQSIPILY